MTYDRVAEAYDDLWSPKVVRPNARLTEALLIKPGDRIADLACGTGVYTLEMAAVAAPGEVVAVDYSEGMLAEARTRAEAAGLKLSLVHARAEEFIAQSEPGTFDVVSLRFVLAYIDWQEVLPRTGRLLRKGGRVGVLTSVKSSVPQFYQLYEKTRGSFEAVWKLYKHNHRDIPDTWKMFRNLRETFADGRFIAVPDSADEPAYVPPMETGGYVLRIREPDWFKHRLFKGPDSAVNVHVFTEGTVEVDRMLAFRDRLRSDDGERLRYELAKRDLAAREWKYIQQYADAKTEVVEAIIARALAERAT